MVDSLAELKFIASDCEFHHIGVATRSINAERASLAVLGYRQEGDVFADPTQGILGCFVSGAGPRLELLENLPASSTLTCWLDAGIKFYHLAYFVSEIDQAITSSRSLRAKVLVPPVPAVAFNGRRICFVMLRNGLTLEFIERPRD